MRLEHYRAVQDEPDGPRPNRLCGNSDLDYDYQAEMTVQEFAREVPTQVRWVLKDDGGTRAIWERKEDRIELVAKSDRFTGQWALSAHCLVLPWLGP